VTGRLRGDEITLTSGSSVYKGQVNANRIEGTATTAGRQTAWTAARSDTRPARNQ
jgi:hypothetical protein